MDQFTETPLMPGGAVISSVEEFIAVDSLSAKQAAERNYDEARDAVSRALLSVDAARTALKEARAEKVRARQEYDDAIKENRKPRQKNVVRRVLDSLSHERAGLTRKSVIEKSGLDATSVSTTLTRCKRAGFVSRDGDDFVGLWVLTDAGAAWLDSEEPMPKI
jgi:DNA-binding IclR family transcriptional regulator